MDRPSPLERDRLEPVWSTMMLLIRIDWVSQGPRSDRRLLRATPRRPLPGLLASAHAAPWPTRLAYPPEPLAAAQISFKSFTKNQNQKKRYMIALGGAPGGMPAKARASTTAAGTEKNPM